MYHSEQLICDLSATFAGIVRLSTQHDKGDKQWLVMQGVAQGLALAAALAGGGEVTTHPDDNTEAGLNVLLAHLATHCYHEPSHDGGAECLAAWCKETVEP